jgi:glycosidase
MSEPPEGSRRWWKEAVVYQVYPRSFDDTDGDGIGDLPGVVERLDHLDHLGVDVVWLCPVYESPNVDNGYDVADYRAIMDEFGTMADWERLRDGLHDRGIRLIMDLVVNHTSDEHEWFRRSRDPDSSYRDWYWWREGRPLDHPDVPEEHRDRSYTGVPAGVDEAPPNDWESFFGGPAWSYDERSGEWYLHLFDERQPDLNWGTPAVREAVFEMMEWWLAKGTDGFRMDVVNLLSKPPDLPDSGDGDGVVRGADRFVNGPHIHDYLSEMYDRVLAPHDAMTVGEMVDLTVSEAREYLEPDGDGMSMAFTFDHMRLDFGPEGRWDLDDWTLTELKATLSHWQYGLSDGGWNALYLGNHDQPRLVSRFGDDGRYRRESAKMLATLLFTLQGTPFVYQGDEIGMTNYPFESLAEVRDVDTIKNVRAARRAGHIESEAELMRVVRHRTRDNARTPMQWSAARNAGFTDGDPWIGVNPNCGEVNVESARADPDSVLNYYRRLVDLRAESDVLVHGDYDLLRPAHEEIWAYTRTLDGVDGAHADAGDGAGGAGGAGGADGEDDRVLVVLNFTDGTPRFDPPSAVADRPASLLVGNYADAAAVDRVRPFALRPYEARVYRLE